MEEQTGLYKQAEHIIPSIPSTSLILVAAGLWGVMEKSSILVMEERTGLDSQAEHLIT